MIVSKKQRDPVWDALKQRGKEKFDADRARFMNEAVSADDGGWIKHTEWHWSRIVAGQRLDYWPSRKKFQYQGTVRRGDVMKFLQSTKNEGGVEPAEAGVER